MKSKFESLIDSYLLNNIGLTEDFLSSELSIRLIENLAELIKSNQLLNAKIGNQSELVENDQIRTDKIFWLDRGHENIHEQKFLDLIDLFVKYLNQSCYTGITNYEFHYALYEAGSFYRRHLDQFKSDSSRAFSMIIYLNLAWENKDGGELVVYNGSNTQKISPDKGKCIFFKSDQLEHEVLVTKKRRISITGWLKTN